MPDKRVHLRIVPGSPTSIDTLALFSKSAISICGSADTGFTPVPAGNPGVAAAGASETIIAAIEACYLSAVEALKAVPFRGIVIPQKRRRALAEQRDTLPAPNAVLPHVIADLIVQVCHGNDLLSVWCRFAPCQRQPR